jgi:hypothetical protein
VRSLIPFPLTIISRINRNIGDSRWRWYGAMIHENIDEDSDSDDGWLWIMVMATMMAMLTMDGYGYGYWHGLW